MVVLTSLNIKGDKNANDIIEKILNSVPRGYLFFMVKINLGRELVFWSGGTIQTWIFQITSIRKYKSLYECCHLTIILSHPDGCIYLPNQKLHIVSYHISLHKVCSDCSQLGLRRHK